MTAFLSSFAEVHSVTVCTKHRMLIEIGMTLAGVRADASSLYQTADALLENEHAISD